jgi:hypothetical protein
MTVFWNFLISCFPGMLLKYCVNDFEIVPVARFVTGSIFVFKRVRKLRKATIDCVMSVCPSAWNSSYCTEFREIWYLNIFRKSVDKIQVSLKSDEINGYCTWKPPYIMIYVSQFVLEWGTFKQKLQRKSEHTFYIQYFFFRKSCRLCNNVEKFGRAREANDINKYNMAHAHCVLDNLGYTHTHTHTQTQTHTQLM